MEVEVEVAAEEAAEEEEEEVEEWCQLTEKDSHTGHQQEGLAAVGVRQVSESLRTVLTKQCKDTC